MHISIMCNCLVDVNQKKFLVKRFSPKIFFGRISDGRTYMHISTILLQVHDYYLSFSFNNLGKSHEHLYKIYAVSVLLANAPYAGRSHGYPKIILSYLLILEHWRSTKYFLVDILKQDMSIVNEELGEISFSMLARCVLGDTVRSDFDHMNKMYKMLPVFTNLRRDVLEDMKTQNSLSGRHQIKIDGPEVTAVAFYFNRMIQQVMDRSFRSYDGSVESFANSLSARNHLCTKFMPRVWKGNIEGYTKTLFTTIEKDLHSKFLSEHHDIWPVPNIPQQEEFDSQDYDDAKDPVEDLAEAKTGDNDWGPDWDECKPSKFALVRSENTFRGVTKVGVSLFKVIDKYGDNLDNPRMNEMQFNGVEWLCDVDNTTSDCLTRGKWHYHGTSYTYVHNNYEVFCYFDSLSDKRLPGDVVEVVQDCMEHEQLFGIVN